MIRYASVLAVFIFLLTGCASTPVSTLIVQGNDKEALESIESSPGPPSSDPGYRNALGEASYAGRTAILKKLLDHGGEVNGTSGKTKITPLHYAAYWKHEPRLEVAQILLERGADPNILDNEGGTPLHYVLLRKSDPTESRIKVEFVRLLLKHGADVTIVSSDKRTTLDWAAIGGGSPEIILDLINAGADPNLFLDLDGLTTYEYAIVSSDEPFQRALIAHGAVPRVIVKEQYWADDILNIYNQFRTSGKEYALYGTVQLENGNLTGARESFVTARNQLHLAETEYQRAATAFESAIPSARAGDIGRAFGSILASAGGIALAATTGIGFISVPKFTNKVEEYEHYILDANKRQKECHTLLEKVEGKIEFIDLELAKINDPVVPLYEITEHTVDGEQYPSAYQTGLKSLPGNSTP